MSEIFSRWTPCDGERRICDDEREFPIYKKRVCQSVSAVPGKIVERITRDFQLIRIDFLSEFRYFWGKRCKESSVSASRIVHFRILDIDKIFDKFREFGRSVENSLLLEVFQD